MRTSVTNKEIPGRYFSCTLAVDAKVPWAFSWDIADCAFLSSAARSFLHLAVPQRKKVRTLVRYESVLVKMLGTMALDVTAPALGDPTKGITEVTTRQPRAAIRRN